MSIRTKMLFFFLTLSFLILLFGASRYLHTENILAPLSPQSITQNAEHLENMIDVRNLLYRLQYDELRSEYALDLYLRTGQLSHLQKYYLYSAAFRSMAQKSPNTYSPLAKALMPALSLYNDLQDRVLLLLRQNDGDAAKQLYASKDYQEAMLRVRTIIHSNVENFSPTAGEGAVVAVRLASNKIVKIFQSDLYSILVTTTDLILISLVLAFLGARAIARPVNQLRKEIEEMDTAGKTLPLSPTLLKSKGEIGTLARAFSALALRLQKVMVSRDELLLEIERREATEQALRTSTLKLEESNRELEQFAYAASHDLRSPLKGIDSLVSWIKEDCEKLLPLDSLNHLDLIQSRVRRLDALITGILEYSRAGKPLATLEWLDLNEILANVISDLAPPPHIKVLLHGALPPLETDKAMIMQLFLNLISNAIKFNDKAQGEVHVGCDAFKAFYQFHVSDNGPGIPEQYFEQIFKPLQTLSSRDVMESTGIGLSIAKKIVESQGGKIWLTSVAGQGTTFYFTWPVSRSV